LINLDPIEYSDVAYSTLPSANKTSPHWSHLQGLLSQADFNPLNQDKYAFH